MWHFVSDTQQGETVILLPVPFLWLGFTRILVPTHTLPPVFSPLPSVIWYDLAVLHATCFPTSLAISISLIRRSAPSKVFTLGFWLWPTPSLSSVLLFPTHLGSCLPSRGSLGTPPEPRGFPSQCVIPWLIWTLWTHFYVILCKPVGLTFPLAPVPVLFCRAPSCCSVVRDPVPCSLKFTPFTPLLASLPWAMCPFSFLLPSFFFLSMLIIHCGIKLLLYSKVTQLHIYIFFFMFFSDMVYHRILNIVPCAIQGSCLSILCIIVYICSSQTPNPPTHLPHGILQSVLQVCDSVSVL